MVPRVVQSRVVEGEPLPSTQDRRISLFWFVVDRMGAESTGARDIWICAALSVLVWHAKPFTVCLAPALAVYVVAHALRCRPVVWRFLAAGFFLPTALVAFALPRGPKGTQGSRWLP